MNQNLKDIEQERKEKMSLRLAVIEMEVQQNESLLKMLAPSNFRHSAQAMPTRVPEETAGEAPGNAPANEEGRT